MAKRTGIGGKFFVDGYDLSGDTGALDQVRGGPALLDMTAIESAAFERQGGIRSGEITWSSFFNTATLQQHAALSGLPTTDRLVSFLVGTTLGDAVAALIGKQINYDPKRGADGSLLLGVQALNNGYGLEWGVQLTAGKITVASTAAQTAVDFGTSYWPAVAITSSSNASPSLVTTTTPHGLVVGDTVNIAGHSVSSLNGDWVVASTPTTTTFTATGANSTGGANTGTITKTSTNFGASSALQVFSVASGTVTPAVQHSADNGVADAWANVTGLVHANVTGRASERVQASTTAIIKRYARFNATNTFTNAVLAAAFCRFLSTP
ncbi:MAG: hypothetical protein NTZ05_14985 [Chloroflexi bacterium]|nr:hypothetical protein [Chloroflexota bacterium]